MKLLHDTGRYIVILALKNIKESYLILPLHHLLIRVLEMQTYVLVIIHTSSLVS